MDIFGEAAAAVAKSRRNVLEFVRQDINLGFTFLDTAKVEQRLRETEVRDRSVRHAQQACDGAVRCLENVSDVASEERDHLQRGIDSLQAAIDEFRPSPKV